MIPGKQIKPRAHPRRQDAALHWRGVNARSAFLVSSRCSVLLATRKPPLLRNIVTLQKIREPGSLP